METEMDAELHFHIETYAMDLVRNGFAARRQCGVREWSLPASSGRKKNAAMHAA
jgi:hypothetical protein